MLNKHKMDSRKFQLTYTRKLFDYENFMNVYYSKYIMEDGEAVNNNRKRYGQSGASPTWQQD